MDDIPEHILAAMRRHTCPFPFDMPRSRKVIAVGLGALIWNRRTYTMWIVKNSGSTLPIRYRYWKRIDIAKPVLPWSNIRVVDDDTDGVKERPYDGAIVKVHGSAGNRRYRWSNNSYHYSLSGMIARRCWFETIVMVRKDEIIASVGLYPSIQIKLPRLPKFSRLNYHMFADRKTFALAFAFAHRGMPEHLALGTMEAYAD